MIDVLAVCLVLLAVVNVGSTVILVVAAFRHRWRALIERAIQAVILAVAALAAAYLGMARLHLVTVTPDVATVLLAGILVALSLPSLIWLIAFLTGRFDE